MNMSRFSTGDEVQFPGVYGSGGFMGTWVIQEVDRDAQTVSIASASNPGDVPKVKPFRECEADGMILKTENRPRDLDPEIGPLWGSR